jgi:predicted DsbA family dithiol-disulfide isomerase
MTKKLTVQVWSDIACPWCYIGKRRFEAALARFAHREDVVLHWRSFELDPSAPRSPQPAGGHAERIARKYGMSVATAKQRTASMTEMAQKEGLDFQFDRLRSGNTFDAHRLLHLADEHGLQGAMKERLLRAYFTEGQPMNDPDVLARLAGESGLDVDAARAMLAGDDFADAVRADERVAAEAGIHGVPFFLIGRYGVSGAQPAELLLEALGKAWSELLPEASTEHIDEGATCGPEGCV